MASQMMAGGGFTTDPDGDVNMDAGTSVPQPIYEFVRPPELADWEHAALVVWYREWNHYVTKIRHRCSVTGEMFTHVVATVKGSIRPRVLDTIATFLLKRPLETISDDDLLQLIRVKTQSLTNAYVPDVKSLFRQSLRMDLRVEDCDARIFRYFQDFKRIEEENGLQGLIGRNDPTVTGHRDRMKARCRLLIENLQPIVLREQIERLVELERRDCKVDDVALFDLVLEHAKVQQRFHRLVQESTSARGATRASSGGSSGGHDSKKSSGQSREQKNRPSPKPAATSAKPETKLPRVSKPPTEGCLYCHGPHWLRECPTATVEQRREALERFRDSKERRTDVVRSKVVKARPTARSVQINGMLEVAYIPDTGADRSVMPSCVVASLRSLQPDLNCEQLNTPVEVVVADGRPITCGSVVTVNLDLQTAAGVVHLRDVLCVVMESDEEELLLGRDILSTLGIDVDDMLAQLAVDGMPAEVDDGFAVGDDSMDPPVFADIRPELERLVSDAVAKGLDAEHAPMLLVLLLEFPDVWQDSLGGGPPADVEPLRVVIRDDAIPYRCKQRKYAPLQSEFLREHVSKLVASGLVRRNNGSRWASAVVPVRKAGSLDEFRMTIDYRNVNSLTIPIAGTMPNIAALMNKVNGAIVFACFDLKNGFWQLPLHEDSQEVLSFMTEDGVYTPLRVPQGAMDSALHFQSQMREVFGDLIPDHVEVWIDDILLFANDIPTYFTVLRQFFTLLDAHNLKLNLVKSSLFTTEVVWCGRVITGEGIRHDPARIDALTDLPLPSTAAELQYFVCAANWLRDSIVDYPRTFAALHVKLEQTRKQIGKRSKNALNIAIAWSDDEKQGYEDAIAAIRNSAMMAFPTDEDEVCVFSDASRLGFSVVITLVHRWDANLPVEEQEHVMVVCKGGLFKDSQLNWTITEKEAYPIVMACSNLSYLLLRRRGFRLFCDHSNLIYLFAPHGELKQHVRDRLQRWALRLNAYRYTIEHIAGANNLWADIVSRWRPQREAQATVYARAVRTRRGTMVPVDELSRLRPLTDDNFQFPTIDDVREAQEAAGRPPKHLALVEEEGLLVREHKPWIPSGATDLLNRIFVVAHCGAQGHRGIEVLTSLVADNFYVDKLAEKATRFARGCLLCKHVKGPRQIQRQYGPTFTATRRNEALHWDYLSLGEGYGDNAYLLVLKDSLTHYCELYPCGSATAYIAAESLLDWVKRFGHPDMLISDQGTHFRNETVDHLCARLKMDRSFSPVYTPWVNGTIERLNKDVLQVLRVLLLDYGLDRHEWPYLLPVVQACLNHAQVRSLAGHSPTELFTGLKPASLLNAIVRQTPDGEELVVVDPEDVSRQIEKLRASLEGMHKEVVAEKERRRLFDMQRKIGAECNFDIGDFVLWSRIDQRLPNDKLLGQWLGPFRVVETTPHAFIIEHLTSGKKHEVHGSRLKYYADSDLNVTQEIIELVSAQGIVLDVKSIRDHRYNDVYHRWELLVSWSGLQEIEDSWEGLDGMLKDVPHLVRQYADSSGDESLITQLD